MSQACCSFYGFPFITVRNEFSYFAVLHASLCNGERELLVGLGLLDSLKLNTFGLVVNIQKFLTQKLHHRS